MRGNDQVRGNDRGQCLTHETLTDYLEGTLEPAVRAVSEVHLVSCDECRTQLAYFMVLLEKEVSAEEKATLQTITEKWQPGKIRQLPRRTGSFPAWFLGSAGIAAVVLLAVGLGYFMERRNEPKSASDIVQLLLANERPFESRMSNEPHVDIVRTRGAGDPGVDYSLLAGQMTDLLAPAHEMGRFYLLQKDFEHATRYLEIAERETAASAAVHNDLGVAYLEGGDPAKVSQADGEFLHAMDLDPKFAPAIFNLALFYEHTNAAARAAAEWKRYLEVDPKSDWSNEVRKRLNNLSR